MTGKEQIMIDGVNVSACISFNKCNGKNLCCYDDTREDKIPFANFCVENKDCYFKQLARKTQECEKLKEQLQANQPTGICETCTAKAILQNDRYRKELEELKRQDYENLKIIHNDFNQIKSLRTECEKLKETNELLKSQMAFNLSEMEIRLGNEVNRSETLLKELKRFDKIKDEFREMSEQLKAKNDRCHKTLEKIEEIVKQVCRTRCVRDCLGTNEYCGYGTIFNIINKAKGEKND